MTELSFQLFHGGSGVGMRFTPVRKAAPALTVQRMAIPPSAFDSGGLAP